MQKQIHYVYEWIRSDLNLPYYIGKGKGDRAYNLSRNDHADKVTKSLLKNGFRRDVRIIARFRTEKAAFEFEKERIAFYWYLKEHDILTNMTMGGEGGASGDLSPSKRPEARARVSIQMSGDNNPMKNPETVKKNKEATKGYKHSDESKLKISLAKIGQGKGIPHTEETKQKLRKPRTPEGKQKNLEAQRKRFKKAKEQGIPHHMKGEKNIGSSIASKNRWEKYREERSSKIFVLSNINSSGLVGVSRVKIKGSDINKWDASVGERGKPNKTKRFDCPAAASFAYQVAVCSDKVG